MGKVFIKSILITILALISFVVVVTFLADFAADMLKEHDYASLIPWIAGIGSTMIAWILFPGIMPFITGFFNTDIIEVIERQDYPPVLVNRSTFWKDLRLDTKFALSAIFANIIVLPLYLIPVVNAVLFFALNGFLLGKQFYLAAARGHVPEERAKELNAKYSRQIFWGGVIIAFFATIPLINLVIPFWGVALMTHLFHLTKNS